MKRIEELNVGNLERRKADAHGKALTSRKAKTDYGAQNKQGIQPRYGKSKGEPVNGPKQGELHEPSNNHV